MAKYLILSALILGISASPNPDANPFNALRARQISAMSSFGAFPSATLGTACMVPTSILSLLESAPTAPPDLLSAFETITDPCEIPSLTGTLKAEYTSLESAYVSWAKQNSAALQSFEDNFTKNCPEAGSATSDLGGDLICSSTKVGGATTQGGTATKTTTKTTGTGAAATATATTSGGSTNVVNTNGGSKEKSMPAAAGLAVGAIGALLAL